MEKWKFLTQPGLELRPPLVVQPVASRYTDRAIPAPNIVLKCLKNVAVAGKTFREIFRDSTGTIFILLQA
jgi:hypothetical protein